MPTVEDGIAAQLRNIEAASGRSVDEWVRLIAASGLTKHTNVVAMLKSEYGLNHGAAHRLSLVARDRLVGAQTSESTSEPNPVQDSLMSAIRALGDDIEEAPKKGYVSLRRRRQFAMVQPGAKWINLGLILRESEAGERLEPAATWNALFTHRVRVRTAAEIDAELLGWLTAAYDDAV